jgi:hypothetical protein
MNDLELKIGNFTFKGIYIAIFLPIISGLAAATVRMVQTLMT